MFCAPRSASPTKFRWMPAIAANFCWVSRNVAVFDPFCGSMVVCRYAPGKLYFEAVSPTYVGTCPECAAEISNQANRCPRCGFPDAGRKSREAAEETKARLETWYAEYRAGGPTFFSQPCPLGEARHEYIVPRAVGHTFEVRTGGKSVGYWVCGTCQCECGHVWEVKF